MPSKCVWSNFGSPSSPQLLYQAPPGAQQLRLPDFLLTAHLGHTDVIVSVMQGIVAVSNHTGKVFVRLWRVESGPTATIALVVTLNDYHAAFTYLELLISVLLSSPTLLR